MALFGKSMRARNIYSPEANAPGGEPFKLSRSKLEDFTRCPRCFFMDRRLGVNRPSMPPFNLNSAVDHLLKKEFDIHRAKGSVHPLLEHYGLKLRPLAHEMMDEWRENFKGVTYFHPATNLIITGAVDDLWQDDQGKVYVVDYKATAKDEAVKELNTDWHESYKRQMEIYQWLLRRNGLDVSNTGYFVYCTGRRDLEAFDGKLEFEINLIEYQGNDAWVEPTIKQAYDCLQAKQAPPLNADCEYCNYRSAAKQFDL